MRLRGSIVLGALALLASVGPTASALEPLPFLRGLPLAGPTHLQLIVAGAPPYVFDVDSGAVRRFPVAHDSTLGVDLTPYRTGALATIDPRRGADTSLVLSASGTHRRATAGETRAARTASLRFAVARAGDAQLAFVDRRTWQRRLLAWKSILGGLDGAIVQPGGQYVAIGFADPAYTGGPEQAEDVFLLNRGTGVFTHVPGFPIRIQLKHSSMAWTDDGRLVLLVADMQGTQIGTYRPGERTVRLRRVALPAPSGGSDRFVPIVSSR